MNMKDIGYCRRRRLTKTLMVLVISKWTELRFTGSECRLTKQGVREVD